MNKKRLLWIVLPVLVVVLAFAFFPQSHSWEEERGYDNPFPGLWTRTYTIDWDPGPDSSYIMANREGSFYGQLLHIGWCRSCVAEETPEGFCQYYFATSIGWRPQTHEETVGLFLVRFDTPSRELTVEMAFSPAYGDNPEDGAAVVIYNSTEFMDQIAGVWQPFRMTILALSGQLAEEWPGCEMIYLLTDLTTGSRRLSTGCPVYPSEIGGL